MTRRRRVVWDPAGARFGLPTFPYRMAPEGLATRRQLAACGLSPGRQGIQAQILWRGGWRVAYLYQVAQARTKRPATAAQLAALARAHQARRTCPDCQCDAGYCLPRRLGMCLDCAQAQGWDLAA